MGRCRESPVSAMREGVVTSTRTKEAAGSARNWRLVVVGAGFEEVELLDA